MARLQDLRLIIRDRETRPKLLSLLKGGNLNLVKSRGVATRGVTIPKNSWSSCEIARMEQE